MNKQTTLRQAVILSGIGLHSGSVVHMRLLPAAADTGITFRRMDVEPVRSMIPARYDMVVDTRLGTTIRNEQGVSVSTIEHVMAALWGAGVDNALVELDAPEVPIMDGSSDPFSKLIAETGTVELPKKRRIIRMLKAVEVREGDSVARIAPNCEGEEGMVLAIEVNYKNALIGRQAAVYDFRDTRFADALSAARTFCFEHEINAMRASGRALGGSLDNAVVVGEQAILNEGGLRFDDEFVRHKALDCVGDLFLAGCRFDAHFTFSRPGHGINNSLLRALFADRSAYEIVDSEAIPALPVAAKNEAVLRA